MPAAAILDSPGGLPMLWKWIGFAVGSAGFGYVSRSSLRHPRSHGFYRFFAWEAILALLLLNVDVWFADPFAWHQCVAWVLLFASVVPVVWGTILLKRKGKPAATRGEDPNLLVFEKTTELVTSGIYRYIRHPLYCSLLVLAWGIFFKRPSVAGAGLAVAAAVFLILTARADEAECTRYFGPSYETYMKTTRRFIPFIY
jgi:protein-S-isoprenylcysteine O-methyltransferase Ste14